MSAAYIQVYFRLNFIMEANTMNPDQMSDLGSYCFQYRVPNNINRRESRGQDVTRGG